MLKNFQCIKVSKGIILIYPNMNKRRRERVVVVMKIKIEKETINTNVFTNPHFQEDSKNINNLNLILVLSHFFGDSMESKDLYEIFSYSEEELLDDLHFSVYAFLSLLSIHPFQFIQKEIEKSKTPAFFYTILNMIEIMPEKEFLQKIIEDEEKVFFFMNILSKNYGKFMDETNSFLHLLKSKNKINLAEIIVKQYVYCYENEDYDGQDFWETMYVQHVINNPLMWIIDLDRYGKNPDVVRQKTAKLAEEIMGHLIKKDRGYYGNKYYNGEILKNFSPFLLLFLLYYYLKDVDAYVIFSKKRHFLEEMWKLLYEYLKNEIHVDYSTWEGGIKYTLNELLGMNIDDYGPIVSTDAIEMLQNFTAMLFEDDEIPPLTKYASLYPLVKSQGYETIGQMEEILPSELCEELYSIKYQPYIIPVLLRYLRIIYDLVDIVPLKDLEKFLEFERIDSDSLKIIELINPYIKENDKQFLFTLIKNIKYTIDLKEIFANINSRYKNIIILNYKENGLFKFFQNKKVIEKIKTKIKKNIQQYEAILKIFEEKGFKINLERTYWIISDTPDQKFFKSMRQQEKNLYKYQLLHFLLPIEEINRIFEEKKMDFSMTEDKIIVKDYLSGVEIVTPFIMTNLAEESQKHTILLDAMFVRDIPLMIPEPDKQMPEKEKKEYYKSQAKFIIKRAYENVQLDEQKLDEIIEEHILPRIERMHEEINYRGITTQYIDFISNPSKRINTHNIIKTWMNKNLHLISPAIIHLLKVWIQNHPLDFELLNKEMKKGNLEPIDLILIIILLRNIYDYTTDLDVKSQIANFIDTYSNNNELFYSLVYLYFITRDDINQAERDAEIEL